LDNKKPPTPVGGVSLPEELYIHDSMAFMTGKSLKFLIGVLNSKLIDSYIKTYIHQYADTGFFLSNQYVERIPIPPITPQNKTIAKKIEALVEEILRIKQKQGYDADTSSLEKQIDCMVSKLYSLTEEEMKLIEKK